MAKILAVDDSKAMLQMVSFTLQQAGHEVIEASNGVEALEVAKRQALDLVLADVNMPKMNGISLIKQLRLLSAHLYTPVLMLTTKAGENRKAEGKSAGATGWIVKSFNPDQRLAMIVKVIG